MSEFVKITPPEQVYGESNLLQCQLNLLTIVKQYRDYEALRKLELNSKIEVKRLVSEIKQELDTLYKLLPESKLEEEQEKEAELIKEIVTEVQKEVRNETLKEKRLEAARKNRLLRLAAKHREEERRRIETEQKEQERKAKEEMKKEAQKLKHETAPAKPVEPKELSLDEELAEIKKKLAKLH